eukprot:4053044-Prymnesium_polylepis.1
MAAGQLSATNGLKDTSSNLARHATDPPRPSTSNAKWHGTSLSLDPHTAVPQFFEDHQHRESKGRNPCGQVASGALNLSPSGVFGHRPHTLWRQLGLAASIHYRLRCVIREPLRLRRWKGCLHVRIDLDERIAEPQKNREEPQTVIAGGSWRT